MIEKGFKEFLKERIKKLGLSMSEVARRANVSRPELYKMLEGDAEAKISTLLGLAKALEIQPIDLLRQIFYQIKPPPSRLKSKTPGDFSGFVADVTYPDNETVTAGSEFTKIWRIQNLGTVNWENRRLVCVDEEMMLYRKEGKEFTKMERIDLLPIEREVPIPTTQPGETVDIAVIFRAPIYPCTTVSYWKMVDAAGEECFPQLKGIWCKVTVVAL